MGEWITISTSAEPIESVNAPNVVSATCVPRYVDLDGNEVAVDASNGEYAGFKGTVTLARSDDAFSHTRRIRLMLTDPVGSSRRQEVGMINSEEFTADTINWVSYTWPRPQGDAVYQQLEFVVENESSLPTATPLTLTTSTDLTIEGLVRPGVTVDEASLPTSVSCEDHPAERWSDGVNLTHTWLYPTAVLPLNHHCEWIDWWISFDNGVGWGYWGRTLIGETARFEELAPHNTVTTWKVKAVTGNSSWQNQYSDAVVSDAFTVTGIANVPVSGTDSIQNAAVTYSTTKDGMRFVPELTWTNSPYSSFFFTRVLVRQGKLTGGVFTPFPDPPAPYDKVGQWRECGSGRTTTPGVVTGWGGGDGWPLPVVGGWSANYPDFQFALIPETRKTDDEWDATNQTAINNVVTTRAAQCWSSNAQTVGNLHIAETAALDQAMFGAGITVTDGKAKLGTDNIANLILNGDFSQGAAQWNFAAPNGITLESAGGVSDSQCVRVATASGSSGITSSVVSCTSGQKYYIEFLARKTAGTDGSVALYARFLDKGGAVLADLGGYNWAAQIPVHATEFTRLSFLATVPTGATSFLVVIGSGSGGNTSVGGFYIDSVFAAKVSTAAEVALGAGLAADAAGYVAVNPGTSIDLSNNQVAVKLGALTSGFFATGSLGADLTKYSADKKPVGVYSYLPSVYDATVPEVIFNTADGKLYRKVGAAWSSGVAPGDIVAGNIASSVTMTGTVYANKIIENGGGITGCRLVLTMNNVVASIANLWDASYGAYAGVCVQRQYYNDRALISYAGMGVINTNGYRAAEVSGTNFGYVRLCDFFGTTGFEAHGDWGVIYLNPRFLWVDSFGRLRSGTTKPMSQYEKDNLGSLV